MNPSVHGHVLTVVLTASSWTHNLTYYLVYFLYLRTFDPEEADFFFVPVLVNCLIYPVFGYADHPWYNGPVCEYKFL